MSNRVLALTPLVLILTACSPRETPMGTRQVAAPTSPLVAPPTPVAPEPAAAAVARSPDNKRTDESIRFLPPIVLGRLAVFPVALAIGAQEDPGPLMLLDVALEKGLAEVREVGAEVVNPGSTQPGITGNTATTGNAVNRNRDDVLEDPQQRAGRLPNNLENQDNRNNLENQDNRNEAVQEQVQVQAGHRAVVDTLVIENKSDTAILVLAGTVVKGGKQDRQIAQDFIVDAHQIAPVDAFCVERGRWTMEREGLETQGRFSTMAVMANSKVRAAGQYAQDQQAVWDNVADTNKAHSKQVASDTLVATLSDPEVESKVKALAASALTALTTATPRGELVGFAWAIDGRITGIRHFAHARVFDLVADKLVRTIAADTVTALALGPAPVDVKLPEVSDLERFVAEVTRASENRRETQAANDNIYQESERAWGSKTELKGKGGKKAKAIAWDYLAK